MCDEISLDEVDERGEILERMRLAFGNCALGENGLTCHPMPRLSIPSFMSSCVAQFAWIPAQWLELNKLLGV